MKHVLLIVLVKEFVNPVRKNKREEDKNDKTKAFYFYITELEGLLL